MTWTPPEELVRRVAKGAYEAVRADTSLPVWEQLSLSLRREWLIAGRGALDASPIGELVEALRKHAILRRERPAIQGIFIPNGFHCNECGTDWGGKGEPVNERHHETCILARANGTGDNND